MPESKAFFARLPTQSSGASRKRYDKLIRSLVQSGVWAKLDALYLFAASDSETALTNLKSSSYGATTVNSPTFTADRGFTGDGSSAYLDTGFNPSTAGGRYEQNDAHVGAWSLLSGQDVGAIIGLSTTSGAGRTILQPRWLDDTTYARVNSVENGSAVAASLNGTGWWVVTRAVAATQLVYRNGVAFGSKNITSDGLANLTITVLMGDLAYFSGQVAAASIGGNLTVDDNVNLHSALLDYLQAVSAV